MHTLSSNLKFLLLWLGLSLLTGCSTLQQWQDQLHDDNQDLPVVRTPQGLLMMLEAVYFEVDSTRLLPSGNLRVGQISKVLAQYSDRKVLVEGHTDNTGDETYNQKLSLARAQSVAEALVKNGIAKERLNIIGYGESRPIADNDTDDGRQKNRRVQIVILNESL